MKDWEKKVRSWAWHRLVFLADRISPEDAFRATGMYVHLKKGEGWVLDDTGVQIWYKGIREYDEHAYDRYDDAPVIGRTVISTSPGGIRLSSDMTPEEAERYVKDALKWRGGHR